MSKNEKIWIILLVAVVVIVIALIIGISRNGNKEEIQKGAEQVINEEKYTTELTDGTKINTSEEFNKSKTYGSL